VNLVRPAFAEQKLLPAIENELQTWLEVSTKCNRRQLLMFPACVIRIRARPTRWQKWRLKCKSRRLWNSV